MSVHFGTMAAMIGAFNGMFVAEALGVTGPMVWMVALICSVSMAIVWWISPLPSHNGGFGMPPARFQKWGFTSETQDGYKDLEDYDYNPILSTSLTGYMPAEREDGDSQ